MKTKTILQALGDFLNADRAAQLNELESVRKILRQLRTKERRLRQQLAATPDPEKQQELSAELEVVHAQRLKGLERVAELRGERQSQRSSRARRSRSIS
jgi:predicted metal-dependent enzyme (double-stranded beta helix superfamily)